MKKRIIILLGAATFVVCAVAWATSIVNPTGGNLIPSSLCPSNDGYNVLNPNPVTQIPPPPPTGGMIGELTNGDTPFPGWTFAPGPALSGTFTIDSYKSLFLGSHFSGAEIEAGYTRGAGDPANLRWVQQVTTNAPLGGATSPYIDPCPNDDNLPFYWTQLEIPSYTDSSSYDLEFYDFSRRSHPPTSFKTWRGTLMLSSWDGATPGVVTIHDGIEWGWDAACINMQILRIIFDEFLPGTIITDQYSVMGVEFSTSNPFGGPYTCEVIDSPTSPPNYLTGDDESIDLNPGPEHGNNVMAESIFIEFFDPKNNFEPALVDFVSMVEVGTNDGNVTMIEGFNLEGMPIAMNQIIGDSGMPGQMLFLDSPEGIHAVVVTFNAPGSMGEFEDNAGIDDLEYFMREGTSGVEEGDQPVNTHNLHRLRQNYPNPFNPRTAIAFELKETLDVRLAVYSIDGRKVATLLEDEMHEGTHEVVWDGKDDHGLNVPSGTYMYRLETSKFIEAKRMTLVR